MDKIKERKNCKECPYIIDNKHNEKFKSRVKRMKEIGIIGDFSHTCHMIKPGWSVPTCDNVCIGSKNTNTRNHDEKEL